MKIFVMSKIPVLVDELSSTYNFKKFYILDVYNGEDLIFRYLLSNARRFKMLLKHYVHFFPEDVYRSEGIYFNYSVRDVFNIKYHDSVVRSHFRCSDIDLINEYRRFER